MIGIISIKVVKTLFILSIIELLISLKKGVKRISLMKPASLKNLNRITILKALCSVLMKTNTTLMSIMKVSSMFHLYEKNLEGPIPIILRTTSTKNIQTNTLSKTSDHPHLGKSTKIALTAPSTIRTATIVLKSQCLTIPFICTFLLTNFLKETQHSKSSCIGGCIALL